MRRGLRTGNRCGVCVFLFAFIHNDIAATPATAWAIAPGPGAASVGSRRGSGRQRELVQRHDGRGPIHLPRPAPRRLLQSASIAHIALGLGAVIHLKHMLVYLLCEFKHIITIRLRGLYSSTMFRCAAARAPATTALSRRARVRGVGRHEASCGAERRQRLGTLAARLVSGCGTDFHMLPWVIRCKGESSDAGGWRELHTQPQTGAIGRDWSAARYGI